MGSLSSAHVYGKGLPALFANDAISITTAPASDASVTTTSPLIIFRTFGARHALTVFVKYIRTCTLIHAHICVESVPRSSYTSSTAIYATTVSPDSFLPTSSLAVI